MVKKTVQTLQQQTIKWYNIYVLRDTKHNRNGKSVHTIKRL